MGKRNVRTKSRSEECQDDLGTFGPKIHPNENYTSIEEEDALLPTPQDLATIVTTKPKLLVRHQQGIHTPNPPEKPNRTRKGLQSPPQSD